MRNIRNRAGLNTANAQGYVKKVLKVSIVRIINFSGFIADDVKVLLYIIILVFCT